MVMKVVAGRERTTGRNPIYIYILYSILLYIEVWGMAWYGVWIIMPPQGQFAYHTEFATLLCCMG
jgi:hypothetical protein